MHDDSAVWLSNDVIMRIASKGSDALEGEESKLFDLGSAVLSVTIMSGTGHGSANAPDAGDLKGFLRRHLAPLDADVRNQVTGFIAAAAGAAPKPSLSQTLAEIREALRERLPIKTNSPDGPRGLIVDHILRLDDRSFYVKGWAHDEEAETIRLTAVSPEGSRAELIPRLFRYPRPDVLEWSSVFSPDAAKRLGFICFFELDAPSLLPGPWVFEMENSDDVAGEVAGPRVTRDVSEVRSEIFHDFADERTLEDGLMAGHVSPALTLLQQRAQADVKVDKVIQYGSPSPSPDVSIIVPVYRNIDHLEAQLAEFADDPSIHDSDLVYVLDSPDDAEAFDHLASHLYPIYLVPFRIVFLDQNAGFAGAINAGASQALGRLLLLLNSDVLPDRPGWLEAMTNFYDSQPHIGALAPKLLYEDDSIQHAGMHFLRRPGQSVWDDAQYFKGLHRTFPGANLTRKVPAVTGACMMIDRVLFQEFGGLSGNFVRGDYEDFDICLRLLDAGRENWYLPDAELYHLEAQSYTPELRQSANRYNVWLHTHLWRDRIEELIERDEFRTETNSNGQLAEGTGRS